MSAESHTIDFILQVNTEQAQQEIGELKIALVRILNLTRRLTGDSDLNRGIGLMQRTIATVNALKVAYTALHVARMAAGDPVAWLTAGLQVAAAGIAMGDTINSISRGY